MSKSKRELAYIYDLYIVPTWRDRFDVLFNEQLGLPVEGQILQVNCGTGGHALEIAKTLSNKGNIVAVDESREMIILAHAKNLLTKAENINFSVSQGSSLSFANNSFDMAIIDASFVSPERLEMHIKELTRVVKPGAQIVVMLPTRGSFDEFFSIFWEALYECNMADEMLSKLESLINERPTVSDMEELLLANGLKAPQSHLKKEEFFYETAEQFFTSPLIEDYQLEHWLSILPKESVEQVRAALLRIIDRERGQYNFDVSIKATIMTAEKRV